MVLWRRRIAGVLAGVTATSMILTGCGQSDESESAKADSVSEELPENIQKSGTIRFGSAMNQTPWSFFDDQHEPTGIEVDLCTEIANRLGVDAKWSDLDWQGLIPGLQAGRFDASCAAIYITPEREEIVSLVPHLKSGLSIMVKDDSDEQVGLLMLPVLTPRSSCDRYPSVSPELSETCLSVIRKA